VGVCVPTEILKYNPGRPDLADDSRHWQTILDTVGRLSGILCDLTTVSDDLQAVPENARSSQLLSQAFAGDG
jgi:hypothetical protein